jgi:hypothetical protein
MSSSQQISSGEVILMNVTSEPKALGSEDEPKALGSEVQAFERLKTDPDLSREQSLSDKWYRSNQEWVKDHNEIYKTFTYEQKVVDSLRRFIPDDDTSSKPRGREFFGPKSFTDFCDWIIDNNIIFARHKLGFGNPTSELKYNKNCPEVDTADWNVHHFIVAKVTLTAAEYKPSNSEALLIHFNGRITALSS